MSERRKNTRSIVLATVAGPDKPGITSELTGILAQSSARILDIGQSVIHGYLSLSILFEDDSEKAAIKDLLFASTGLGLRLEFQVISPSQLKKRQLGAKVYRYALTLIGQEITASSLHAVTASLAKFGLNIDLIQPLSEGDFSCVEFLVSSTAVIDQHIMKKELLSIAQREGVDIALQTEGLFRKAKRLVVFDMDSTLIQNEVIDEFARQRGVYDKVAEITARAMRGEIDYDESLRQRCEMLRGLKQSEVDEVFTRLKITPGADNLIRILKKLGYKIALISGSFTCIADRIKDLLGLDYAYANRMELVSGEFTGVVYNPIVNAQRKADLLDLIAQQEKIHLEQVIAIGDGANDLLMLEKAGLGIAFNAKPTVRERADMSLNQKNLHSIFYLLGISSRDVSDLLQKI